MQLTAQLRHAFDVDLSSSHGRRDNATKGFAIRLLVHSGMRICFGAAAFNVATGLRPIEPTH
jgi:hypothetical protein